MLTVQSLKYVSASQIFDGLPLAQEAFAGYESYSFSWGDNNHSLIDLRTFCTAIQDRISDEGADYSTMGQQQPDEDAPSPTAKELKQALDRLDEIGSDVYIDLEAGV